MYCDLHAHSNFSDGTLSPTELIALAKQNGLGAIALTDHNTIAGLPEFLAAAKEQGMNAVAGTEISTTYKDKELHLLALFIPVSAYALLEGKMAQYHAFKEASNLDLVARLNDAGYTISYEDVKKRSKTGNINRAHIAAELTACGFTPSIKAAFDELLKPGGGFYTPPQRWNVFDAIRMVRSLGALPVIAHPLQELSEEELREFLPSAVEAGLVGMETMQSSFTSEKTEIAKRLAKEFSLLESGGSDFHGGNKPHVRLGGTTEGCPVPFEFFERLSQRQA